MPIRMTGRFTATLTTARFRWPGRSQPCISLAEPTAERVAFRQEPHKLAWE